MVSGLACLSRPKRSAKNRWSSSGNSAEVFIAQPPVLRRPGAGMPKKAVRGLHTDTNNCSPHRHGQGKSIMQVGDVPRPLQPGKAGTTCESQIGVSDPGCADQSNQLEYEDQCGG